MINTELKRILDDFKKGQKELKALTIEAQIEKLSQLFEPIAKHLLCGGCFEVYSGDKLVRRVFPYTVEFYYHEEGEGVKDPIVYHKNTPDYFEPGTINAHQSGIDITFENGDDDAKYRASALIRAFRVKEGDDIKAKYKDDYDRKSYAKSKDVEYRSTYIYDYLLTNIPMPITIKWVSLDTGIDIEPIKGYRVNVFKYDSNLEKTKELDRKPWAFSLEEFPNKYKLA